MKNDTFDFLEDKNDSLDDFCSMIFKFAKNNPNEFRNYYPYIKEISELNIPDTVIVPLTSNFIKCICLEKFNEDIYLEFTNYILEKINEKEFTLSRDLFIKDGKFSNKFNFSSAYIPNGEIDTIGKKSMEILYGDMCLHDFPSTDIIIREFVHTTYKRPSIYFGMKLNTEFRVFYNFNKNEIMNIVNYWDYDTMINNLFDKKLQTPEGPIDIFDKTIFLSVGKEIENDYLKLKPKLKNLINDILPNVNLKGEYSLDFLWDGEKFRLIDMAIVSQSYYYDKVKKK